MHEDPCLFTQLSRLWVLAVFVDYHGGGLVALVHHCVMRCWRFVCALEMVQCSTMGAQSLQCDLGLGAHQFIQQVDEIPTVGFSNPLLSYITAFQYVINSRKMIEEGYNKVKSGSKDYFLR
jgi:hypothetical protein